MVYFETDTFNSVGDLIQQFQGSFIYVAIWATWCKPCLEAFSSSPKVEELAKGKPVVLLYVSIDKTKRRKRWKRIIEENHLSGYHVIAHDKLQEDLWRVIHHQSTRVEIPHYLVIDKQGEVIMKEAPAPSQTELLKEKIDSLIADSEQ